jgi:cobalt-precorrin-7 (C5)-methyltransferase
MIIRVVGIGPAGSHWMTAEAKEALQWAQFIIGTQRQLECVKGLIDLSQKTYAYESLTKDMTAKIDAFIESEVKISENPKGNFTKWGLGVVVLASGDPSLYGIGKYLVNRYGQEMVTVTAGISSVQYLFAAVGQDMNDVYITSCHGREVNFDRVFSMPKTALLTDDKIGPYQIAAEAIKRGLNPKIIIGESLGYENKERYQIGPATEVLNRAYDMNVVIVINEEA